MVLEFIGKNLIKGRDGWWVNNKLVDQIDYYPVVIEPSGKVEYISITSTHVFYKLVDSKTSVCELDYFISEEIWLY